MQLGSLQYPRNPMKGASEHFHFFLVLAGGHGSVPPARACFFGLDPGCRAMFFVAAPWFSTSGNQKSHCSRWGGTTFSPADEDELRRRIPENEFQPEDELRRRIPEAEFRPEAEFPPEGELRRRIPQNEFQPEDELRRRIRRRRILRSRILPRSRIHPRRRIAQTNSPKPNSPPKPNSLPKTNCEDNSPEPSSLKNTGSPNECR